MKKFFSLFLAFILMLSFFPLRVEASEDSSVWEAEIVEDEKIDTPFYADEVLGSDNANISSLEFGKMDGEDVIFTASKGSGNYPSYFNVVNIRTGENMFSETIPGATTVWGFANTKQGVFIGTTGTQAALWRFDTEQKELEKMASLVGDKNVFNMRSNDKYVVLGTYPQGKVYVYDLKAEKLLDLGVVDKGKREEGIADLPGYEEYVRSVELYDEIIFAGTGAQNGRVWTYDMSEEDAQWRLLEMPIEDPKTFPNLSLIYDLNIVEDKLFVFSNGPSEVYIYDLKTKTWLDHTIKDVRGMIGVSNEFKRKVFYAHKEQIGTSNEYRYSLHSYHLDTAEVKKETEAFPLNLRNTHVYEIDGQERLYTMNNQGKIVYFYEEAGELKVHTKMDTIMMGQPGQIQSIHYDDVTDSLFASGYMGSQGYQRDMKTGDAYRFQLGQVENMDSENGQIYFGEYPSARIVSKDIKKDRSVKQLFSLSDENQDRPYMVLAQDGMLYLGTIGKSAELTGRLAIYDTKKDIIPGENPKVYTPLKDHSIVGIAVKGDYLYGSSTIHGGLGTAPVAKQAQVFKFNLKTGEVEVKRELSELKQSISMISGLHFDEKGRLLGFTNGTIFELDQETLEVKRHKVLYRSVSNFGQWRPVEAYYHDGKLYANPYFTLTVIDPETFKHAEIKEKVDKFAVDQRGDILYASEVELNRMKVKVHEKDISDLSVELIEIPLKNSSFEEQDEQGRPLHWRPYFDQIYDKTDYRVSDELQTDGDHSLKIFDRNGSASMFVTSENIPVSEGEKYVARTKVYLDNGRARLFIRFYDGEGRQVQKDDRESLVYLENDYGAWYELEANAQVPENAEYLRVTVGTSNADQTEHAYFDDVRLYRKEEKVKLAVPNASFEEGYLAEDGRMKPKHWSSMSQDEDRDSNVYFQQSDDVAFDGEKSLFVYDKSTQAEMYVQSEKIPVEAGDEHELKVQMYFAKQLYSTRAAQVMIRYYDENDQIVSEDLEGENYITQGASGMTGRWIEQVLQTKAPENAAYLRIILGSNRSQATDGVYYDQVDLYRYGSDNSEDLEEIPKQEVKLQESLMNPSFEDLDEYGRIKHWTSLLNHEEVSEDVYYYSSDEKVVDGKRSLYLYDKDNSHSMFVASDPFKVEAGEVHETKVSVYLVEENIDSRLTGLLIRYYDENNKQVGKDALVHLKASESKGEWTELSLTTQAPENADRMRIILGTANAGQNHVGAYYDDVQFTRLRPIEEFKTLYAKAQKKDLSAYSLESSEAYENVLTKYRELLDEKAIREESMLAFIEELEAAEKDLKLVDYSSIEKALSEYEAIDFTEIEEESLNDVHELFEEAKALVDEKERSQKRIDEQAKALNEALGSLKKIDRQELDRLIEEAEAIQKVFYEETSYEAMLLVLEEAKAYQGQNQKEIDLLVEKLTKAMESLEELEIFSLEELVEFALELDEDDYSEASFAKVQLALEEALILLENPNEDEESIALALEKLENAIKQLEFKEIDDEDSGSEDEDHESDDEDSGSEDEDHESDDEDSGSEDEDHESDDEDSGSEDEDHESDDEDIGSEDEDQESDDEDSGLEDEDHESDDEDSGSDGNGVIIEKDESEQDDEVDQAEDESDKEDELVGGHESKDLDEKDASQESTESIQEEAQDKADHLVATGHFPMTYVFAFLAILSGAIIQIFKKD